MPSPAPPASRLDPGTLLPGLIALLLPTAAIAGPNTTSVFVQWDEQYLVAGNADDAPNGVSWTLDWFGLADVTMPAFTAGPMQDEAQIKAATLQMVREQWAAFDVEFVETRPAAGPFLMITMGGSGGLVNLGGAGGWGIIDCYDQNKTAVAFTFGESMKDMNGDASAARLAMVISQEIAHTVGLEHLADDDTLIMYPSASNSGDHHFGTTCLPITGAVMDPNNAEYCLDHPGCPVGEQNDTAHLIAYLGAYDPNPGGTGSSGSGGSGGSSGTGSSGSDGSGGSSGSGGATAGTGSGGYSAGGSAASGESGAGGTWGGTAASGSGDGEQGEPPPEGCGCTAPRDRNGPWLLLLLLFAYSLRRRE